MSPAFNKFLVCKLMGWTMAPGEDTLIPEEKAIFLAAPHTSIFDFVIGYLYYRAIGGHLRAMVKKEAFFFPLGPILKALGAFPIDRSSPQTMLMGVIHEMKKEGVVHIVICPEGTRKAVRKWKTGYHTIAKATGAPVYLGHYDYKTKVFGHGPKVELTDDARKDTDRIQQMYEEMHLTALHPKGYVTK